MKILVCTANQPRHVTLVRALKAAGHDVMTIVEPKSYARPAGVRGEYLHRVREAELSLFGMAWTMPGPVLTLPPGELSAIADIIVQRWSDRFPVVSSSSYIRGDLATHFLSLGALNLHVGVAPEYRGSAPNMWAWYDKNEHLVGCQTQRLSLKLDAGEILTDTRGLDVERDPFMRGMLACSLGINALVHLLSREPSTWQPCVTNDPARQIRYAKHADFMDAIAEELLARADADDATV